MDRANEFTHLGIRNPVGIAIEPTTGELWTSVNERDALGDDLVPDYITHVIDGGFYGWPWYYIGSNQDPRHAGKHPELNEQSDRCRMYCFNRTSASLEMTFYDGKMFPAEYSAGMRSRPNTDPGTARSGQATKLFASRCTMEKPVASTWISLLGLCRPNGDVWGRPVGVAVASDGALIFTDDGSDSVWRVSYTGSK